MDKLIIVRPICELQGWNRRMEIILGNILEKMSGEDIEVVLIEKASELRYTDLKRKHIIFAVSLTEAGVNMEYYRLLEYFRSNADCLEGSVAGIIVDGRSGLFTKALARRLAFSANAAGCTFPGKPLVEATGDLANFHVLSTVRGVDPETVYIQQVESLISRVLEFRLPPPSDLSHLPDNSDRSARPAFSNCSELSGFSGYAASEAGQKKLKVLAIHASSRKTSNTLLLWDMVRRRLVDRAEITEISLRNGDMKDCIGCRYEDCLHFGEMGRCFYGGIMTEQVYPAILDCDALIMICPNYNDALNAHLTAFINRLTALFRVHDFSHKSVYALIVSGYSGGDIVSEQVIGALNFNKGFILPGHFAMVETANDPKSILEVPDIDAKAGAFAARIS